MPKNPHAPSAFSAKSFCEGKFPHFALRENLYSRICNSASHVTKFHIVQYMWVIRTVNEVAMAYYIKFWNLGMFLYWSPLFFFPLSLFKNEEIKKMAREVEIQTQITNAAQVRTKENSETFWLFTKQKDVWPFCIVRTCKSYQAISDFRTQSSSPL